jgi:predicted acetyltransferase
VEVTIRSIAPDELEAWARAVESAFGAALRPEALEMERMIAEPDRYLAAFDGGRIVGGNASVRVELAVPGGGRVAACAINGVGVVPGATRRGISTALMRRQIDAARERGEPVAVLHASEASIYGRYGFGTATRNATMVIDRARAGFVRGYSSGGEVRLVGRDEALEVMVQVLERLSDRPGWLGPTSRFASWQIRDAEIDDDFPKDEPPFFAVHDGEPGAPDGVVAYRVKRDWPEGVPRQRVVLYELLGADPQAQADLWRFLLDLDLVGTVEAWHRPVDDPLFRLVREPRALRMRIVDGLHLAFVDLPTALETRGYAGEGTVVLEVDDPFCPWNGGRWALRVDGGRAACERTDLEPDVSLTSTDLASTFLGDASFADLAAALRVGGRDGGAAVADELFASSPPPWCWLGI